MDVNYLIYLWQNSNFDSILIKSLPLARGTDKIIVEPTAIFYKNESLSFGKTLTSFEYIKIIYKDSLFEYIEDSEILIMKEIYRR